MIKSRLNGQFALVIYGTLTKINWSGSFLFPSAQCLTHKSVWQLWNRYLLRFFDSLAHPNLSATFATDKKLPFSCLPISCQSLAGSLRSLKKLEFLKLIISFFHYFWCQNRDQWHKMSGKNTHIYFFYFCFKNKRV